MFFFMILIKLIKLYFAIDFLKLISLTRKLNLILFQPNLKNNNSKVTLVGWQKGYFQHKFVFVPGVVFIYFLNLFISFPWEYFGPTLHLFGLSLFCPFCPKKPKIRCLFISREKVLLQNKHT